jgi:hypothetical protein
MKKRIFLFSILIISISIITSIFHSHLSADKLLSFNIKNIYLFNVVSSSIIYAVIEFVFKKNIDYVGYAYLYGAFIKLLIFSIIFNKIYLSKISLSFYEKWSLIFVFSFYLFFEIWFVIKLINSPQKKAFKQ